MRIFTDSPWRQTGATPVAGAKIPSGEIAFAGTVRFGSADSFKGGARAQALAEKLFHAKPDPALVYEVDTTAIPGSTTLNGSLGIIKNVLSEAEKSMTGKVNDHAYVVLTFNQADDVALLQSVAKKLQRVVKPGAFDFLAQVARGAARTTAGIRGDVVSLDVRVNPQNPCQAVVRAGLKDVDAADVGRLKNFMDQCAPLLAVLGITG